MIHLNDKWALDGRDPNSYTGVFWVLGRHDRAWGPEREIFGKVRYMTSDSPKENIEPNLISKNIHEGSNCQFTHMMQIIATQEKLYGIGTIAMEHLDASCQSGKN